MYSMILMTAMASSPSAPEFNGYFRDRWNCNGCSGTSAASFGGCNGCSCHGGLFSGERVRSLFSFGGNGSCCGCNGCSGSCIGSCNGSFAVSSGCCGAAAMYSCGGGYVDYIMPVSAGCFGGTSIPFNPAPMGTIPPTNLPGTPYAQPAPAEVREYSPKNQLPPPSSLASSPNRATVIVKLPADAKLLAEGQTLNLTGPERMFVSPELPAGKEYNYTFRIEYDRGGQMLTETRTIAVTPGKLDTIEFEDKSQKGGSIPKSIPETKAVATSVSKSEATGDRARLIVRVPAGGTLYVNDAKQPTGELVKEFRTPPLPAGKEFVYTFKVETLRNGMPESVSQQVKFRAGDSITVDLGGGTPYDAAIR